MSEAPQIYYRVWEAAQYARVSENTIRRWIKDGILPTARPGLSGSEKRGGKPHLIHIDDLKKALEPTRSVGGESYQRRIDEIEAKEVEP
jgi:excisionase family DNA binding protein